MATLNLLSQHGVGSFRGPYCSFHHDPRTGSSVPHSSASVISSTSMCYVQPCPAPRPQNLHSWPSVQRYHQGTTYSTSPSCVLLQTLPRLEEGGYFAPGPGPLTSERLPGCPALQDGVHSVHRHEHRGTHVGLHPGFGGRILPRPHQLAVPLLPGLRPGQPGIRLPVPSLWSGVGSLGLQSGHKPYQESPSSSVDPCPLLSGRLLLPPVLTRGPSSSVGLRPGPLPQTGHFRELRQVEPHSISRCAISGCSLSSQHSHPLTSTVQGGPHLLPCPGYDVPSTVLPSPSGEPDGRPQLGVEFCPSRKATSQTPDKVDELKHLTFNKRSPSSSGQCLPVFSAGLVRPFLPGTLGPHVPAASVTPADDRCFTDRLVRDPPTSSGGRNLASGVRRSLVQLPRAAGHPLVPSPLHPDSPRKGGDGDDGQYDCSRLSSTSGIIPVGSADGSVSLHPDSLPSSQHHADSQTHQRGAECSGGPGFQGLTDPYGVVSGPADLQVASASGQSSWVAQAPSGPLCHPAQCPAQRLRLPCSGRLGGRGECSLPRLGCVDISVPVPSSQPPQQAPSASLALQGQRHPGCTFSRQGRLVPYACRKVSSPVPSADFPLPVSSDQPRKGVPQVSPGFAASRLDTVRSALQASGFSMASLDIACQAHRASTLRQYQTVWKYFLDFLAKEEVSPSEVTEATVCNFLAFHAGMFGRKYRTLSAYRSALRHPIFLACGVDINGFSSNFFLRGLFNFEPPQRARAMPRWSLEDLLIYLRSSTFEPLRSAPFSRVLQKALCLILLASGRRIGDVASLSRSSSPHPAYDALTLHWVDGYVPKFRSTSWSPSTPSIGRLASDPSLCPVRAYREYLDRVSPWFARLPVTRRHRYLWVNNNRSVSRMPKDQLTRWFISLVKDSRRFHNLPVTVPIGPHQCRKFAASFSVLLGQDLDRVIDVMGFSSTRVFLKNYVGQVPPLGISCVFPGGPYSPSNSST